MSRYDRLAVLLSLLGLIAAYAVASRVFEQLPHLEDDVAYIWQAQTMAGGEIRLPTPPESKSFLVPFVVDYNGFRFGKYPPGWPAVLSLGVRLDVRSWVNPFLAALGVWLTYLLGKRVLTPRVALLAAALTVVSPFFLINSGSLLSHPLGYVLSAGFALAWLAAFDGHPSQEPPGFAPPSTASTSPRWFPAVAAGACLGLLALTRPLTAVGVALPFAIHGMYLLWRGDRYTRLRLLAFGGIALSMGMLLFAWQAALTGDPFLNPYTLWWPYDKIGFGPGYGVLEAGHSLAQARFNTAASLRGGFGDLFGWWRVSWIFLPFGLWAGRRNRGLLLLAGVFLSLVLVHLAYWIGSWVYGPRYYYEALYSLTLLSAAGIAWLMGWPVDASSAATNARTPRWRGWLVGGLVVMLVAYNLAVYLPARFSALTGLYGVRRQQLEPFLTPEAVALAPALIVVHIDDSWREYGALLDLSSPYLDTPLIFAVSRGSASDQSLSAAFPQRSTYHYYPDDPYAFYTAARPPVVAP